jgi:SAM-dependent methyltransferase
MKEASDVNKYRELWEKKGALRRVYQNYHDCILAACRNGSTLEIGGGSGHFRKAKGGIVSIDIQPLAWLDAVADAHHLPFGGSTFDNIVMLDVLHHLSLPRLFFIEAQRILKPGGRLVMMEPAMTPVSRTILSLFHEEPVDLSARPLDDAPQTGERPEDANQAIPHLIFNRFQEKFSKLFPQLIVLEKKYLSLWAYPLSGGFKAWSLMPPFLVRPLLALEYFAMPVLGPLAAFRLFIVLKKDAGCCIMPKPNE